MYVCKIPIHCRQQTRKFQAIHVGPAYLDHPSRNFPRLTLTDDLTQVLTSFKIIKIDESA